MTAACGASLSLRSPSASAHNSPPKCRMPLIRRLADIEVQLGKIVYLWNDSQIDTRTRNEREAPLLSERQTLNQQLAGLPQEEVRLLGQAASRRPRPCAPAPLQGDGNGKPRSGRPNGTKRGTRRLMRLTRPSAQRWSRSAAGSSSKQRRDVDEFFEGILRRKTASVWTRSRPSGINTLRNMAPTTSGLLMAGWKSRRSGWPRTPEVCKNHRPRRRSPYPKPRAPFQQPSAPPISDTVAVAGLGIAAVVVLLLVAGGIVLIVRWRRSLWEPVTEANLPHPPTTYGSAQWADAVKSVRDRACVSTGRLPW